jgi:hypothetical protein
MKNFFMNIKLLLPVFLLFQPLVARPIYTGLSTGRQPTSALTMQFTGMTPHVGERLEIRIIDKYDSKEAGRTIVDPVPSADFTANVDGIQAGHSYWIDFYADHNKNGRFDPPPVDHAWELELNNATGSDVVNFAHNTNFTNIDWKYMLSVHLTGMIPHVGQLFELRVIDDSTNTEVGRVRVASIPAPDFDVNLPVLPYNNSNYTMDFYADENRNGLFDPPPTDHAWEIKFNNDFHDTTINFAHNTNFTNFNWVYLLTFNLNAMTPHLGELVALRLVRDNDNAELSRVIIPSLPLADVSVDLPGIELNQDYHIDFWADANKNGIYDPPPVDHAWRVMFNSGSTGNDTLNFTHNTNFTDIGWPSNVSDVRFEKGSTPESFILNQNYPNPFNPSTVIRYQIPSDSKVELIVYDALGREVQTLVNGQQGAGVYEVTFNAARLTSGIYFYRLTADEYTSVRKLVLIR